MTIVCLTNTALLSIDMHTSLHPDGRSGHDASSSSGPYFRNTRGFGYRKRGSYYRGRGGSSYHRSHGSWHDRTTPKKEPEGDAHALSLLSRLEPSTDSLLSRLSPPQDTPNSGSAPTLSLANRLAGEEGAYSRGESMSRMEGDDSVANSSSDSGNGSTGNDLLVRNLHLLLWIVD